jgi:flagellar hook-associated protein 1
MSNLFASLNASSSALRVYSQALEVTGNNVTNASTPGYARQRASREALPFDPSQGLLGGVTTGDLQSARDQYADLQVRRQISAWGASDQEATSLQNLQNIFPVAEDSGIASELNGLFSSFSAWSQSPNDANLRQSVLNSADSLARSFREAAADLNQMSTDTDGQIGQAVTQINNLTAKLQQLNQERRQTGSSDPAWEASVESTLESLSEWTDISVNREADGSVTVLLGGQTPLVAGDQQYTISAESGGPAGTSVLRSSDGRDITAQVSGGRLAGLLDVRNRVLPSFTGNASQPGDLNRLAQGVADTINQILESGYIADGTPPQQGVALFSYDASNPNLAAASLSVDSTISADQLAAIDPGPPYSSNGIPLKLANLATQSGQLDGASFTGFFGNLSARAGWETSQVQDARDQQQQQVSQAKSLRNQISGVSLDDEAVYLVQYQRAYEAAAKTVSVLDSLLETTINMLNR